MLKCPCGLAYAEKTTRPLNTRITEHRCAIRNHSLTHPVAVHFTEAQQNISNVRYIGMEGVKFPSREVYIDPLLLRR